MKVLYVGPFRDPSGWGRGANDWILSLDAAGVEVVPRCIRYRRGPGEPLPRVLELEKRSDKGCDVVIQCCIPDGFDYHGGFARNVGLYFSEVDDFASSCWPRHINTMDEAWVPCNAGRDASTASGVTIPLRVIGCGADMSRFERSYRPHPVRDRHPGSFLFYTIGEGIRRKNFKALVVAFHIEFGPSEPVELVIKTSIPSLPPSRAIAATRLELAKVHAELGLYADDSHYKREIILADYLSVEAISRLHAACDCYVGPGYGEGWGIPAFDALAFGKTPIATACGAHLDYLSDEVGWLVPGHKAPVMGMASCDASLYTGRQEWTEIDIASLRAAMRQAYEDRELREHKSLAGIERAYDFSHAAVGRRMKGHLES